MANDAPSGRDFAGKKDYVRQLEQRRDPEALALLVQCLSDESGYLRDLAEGALLRLGGRAAELVLPLLDQGLWYSRSSAARLLGGLRHAAAVAPLLGRAEDPVENVAREAFVALAALARSGASTRIAWEIHRLPAERRLTRLARLRHVDRAVATRVEQLMGLERVTTAADPDTLRDDAPGMPAPEEGAHWQTTNPPRSQTPTPTDGGGPSSR